MNNFFVEALSMIKAPNYYSSSQEGWVIKENSPSTLYLMIGISDSLGERRYVPESGSSFSVIFQRADRIYSDEFSFPTSIQADTQTVTKTAIQDSQDPSIFSIPLTIDEVNTIISGTVKFSLVQPTEQSCDWVQNYFIQKHKNSSGF